MYEEKRSEIEKCLQVLKNFESFNGQSAIYEKIKIW